MKEFEFASSAQQAFFKAGPQPTLYLSGYGGGKTVIGILKMLYLLDQYPYSKGAIIRRSYTQLNKTTAVTLRQWLPMDRVTRWNEQMGILELANGSTLYMLYLDSADSLGVLKGLELNFAFVDQVEELAEDAWDLLDTRCGRWSGATRKGGWPENWPHKNPAGNPLPPKYLMAAANSPGYDTWVYDRFADESENRARWKAEGYITFKSSSRQNKFLGDATLKSLLAKGDSFVRRYVDADDWGAREGLIFDISPLSILDPDANEGLLENLHVRMKLHMCMDHGETAPTCVLWYAVDHEGRIFVYREYYRADALVSDHRKAIFELSQKDAVNRSEGKLPKYASQIADPSIFSKSRGRSLNEGPRWSVADEYSDSTAMPKETAIFWSPGVNNEEATRTRLKEYLRVDPGMTHPVTGERGSPRLFFFRKTKKHPDGCFHVLREVAAQKYRETGATADGQKIYSEARDDTVVDHSYDALKYGVVSRPALGSEPALPRPGPGKLRVSEYDAITATGRRSKRGSYYEKAGYGR